MSTEYKSVAEVLRDDQACRPGDKRQKSHRFGAVWGKPRITQNGTVFAKHYESLLDDVIVVEYTTLSQKEQTIKNAKAWAKKTFPDLDKDDLMQEIDIKVWQLEGEVNEGGDWARPAYVMTALKNTIYDYARKEIGYQKSTTVKADVIARTRFDAPAADEDIVFTSKTLKAGLLLFIAAPNQLSLQTKDRLYSVYRQLSNAEHKSLLQCVLQPTDSSIRTLDRLVSKYLDSSNE